MSKSISVSQVCLSREQYDAWAGSCPEALENTVTWWDDFEALKVEGQPVGLSSSGQLHRLYDSAEAVGKGLADIALIEQAFEASSFGEPFFEAVNRLFGDMVRVDEPDTVNTEIVGAVVVEAGFIPKVKVTRADGSSSIVPASMPGSGNLMLWTPKAFSAALGARKMALLEFKRFAVEDDPLGKNIH